MGKFIDTESRLVVARARERREWGVGDKGMELLFLNDKNVLELAVMIAQSCDYAKKKKKTHCIVCLKV